jgi:hypothetical protein
MPKFVKILLVCLVCLTVVGGAAWWLQWLLA